jgi:hypothetical protein
MTLARQESSIPSYGIDDTSPVLTRQLYLHGMTYLLRGLPSDLTPEELLSLQAAAPQALVTAQADPASHALVPRSGQSQVARGMSPQDPSILHRITATHLCSRPSSSSSSSCHISRSSLRTHINSNASIRSQGASSTAALPRWTTLDGGVFDCRRQSAR